MRRVLVGSIAIALFTAAAVGVVWALTADRGPAASATAPPQSVPPAPMEPALALSPSPIAGLAPPPAPPPKVVYGPPRVEPPRDSWEAVEIAARPSALGPLGGAIGRGLNELQPRLAACFDEDTAARFGTKPRTVAVDASLPNGGPPVLVLEIETGGGAARIVDAPVDTQGTASDGVIACAQSVLRGQRFDYPQAPAGGRYRMLHPLIP